jgi:uncharacterized protein
METKITPVKATERIVTLDVLRGFALFGILLMNIQSFAMPEAAYFIPAAYGDLTGANRVVWWYSYLFADQKFMTLFSMLFGAGIILMTAKAERSGRPTLGLHYRRMFWLLVIGLLHGYLLWSGDILVLYAICGFIVYWFRNWPPRRLLIVGLMVFAVGPLIAFAGAQMVPLAPPEVGAELAADFWPAPEVIAAEVAAYRGGWLEQMSVRAPTTLEMQTVALLYWGFWRAGGLMLMGMALFKWGVFSGQRSTRFYAILIAIGALIALPIVAWGGYQNFAHGWDPIYVRLGAGYQFNYWASVFVSLGYVGVLILWLRTTWLPWLQHALAAVGRTALTNYLIQTLLATFIFYGHGLAFFGSATRLQQLLVVLGIWTIELIVSPLWLRYFRFGPAEWLWRSLTYWQVQPMRIKPAAVSASVAGGRSA